MLAVEEGEVVVEDVVTIEVMDVDEEPVEDVEVDVDQGSGSSNNRSISIWSSNTSQVVVQPFNRPVGPAVALSAS